MSRGTILMAFALLVAVPMAGAIRPSLPGGGGVRGPLALHTAVSGPIASIPPEGPCREIIWAACALHFVDVAGLYRVPVP